MDKEKLLVGVLFGLIAQTMTFFQLQGPIKYDWFKNHYWLVVLMGIPIFIVGILIDVINLNLLVDFSTNTIGVSDHLYGWSKLTAERMIWELNKTTDLRFSVVRPFSGYGPTQSRDYPIPNLMHIVKNHPDKLEVWGTGEQSRDFVYIDDILSTFDWLIHRDHKLQVVNIGTGIQTSFIDVIHIMHELVYNTPAQNIMTHDDKPVGVMHRYADTVLQESLDILPTTSLVNGLRSLL